MFQKIPIFSSKLSSPRRKKHSSEDYSTCKEDKKNFGAQNGMKYGQIFHNWIFEIKKIEQKNQSPGSIHL